MEWENKEKYEQLIQFPKKKKLNQTGKTFIPNKNMKVLFQTYCNKDSTCKAPKKKKHYY